MWDLPGPGIELMSPALAGRFLSTVPPGKPRIFPFLLNNFFFSFSFRPISAGQWMESQKESLNSFLAMFPSWWNPSFATYTTFLQKPSSSTTRKQRYLPGSHTVKGQVTVASAWAGSERTGSLSGVGEGCPDFLLCFSLRIGNVGHWCFVCTLHRPHNESQMRQCMKNKHSS